MYRGEKEFRNKHEDCEEDDFRCKHEDCEEDEFRCRREKCEGLRHRGALSRFILRNFRGAHITIVLVNKEIVKGEVVDGFDDVIALKKHHIIRFINERFITTFV